MLRSVRHEAHHQLRTQRRKARRGGARRPPWPGVWRRLASAGASWTHRPVGMLTILAVWVTALSGIALARPASTGITAATTSSLEVLWQVQATSVGIVLAIVVFVFGLLPQGRGRLTYREFLRRTWAVRLIIFNVGSLLFDGLVLLGVGHQVPASHGTAGHGWAVTVASVTALVSIASIVLLLARTMLAIAPTTNEAAQREFRLKAILQEVRSELCERASLGVMWDLNKTGLCSFNPAYMSPGIPITATRTATLVWDVSVWRLRLLRRLSMRRGGKPPVLLVWPGRSVGTSRPLMVIDPSSGRLAEWWARRCIRLRTAPPDLFGSAVEALHATTLDDIRSDRPVEATEGMQALAELHEPMWQAYATHCLPYDRDARQIFWRYRRTVGDRIINLLDAELCAAAISRDAKIRGEATYLPRRLAREAVAVQAAGTIEQSLGMLLDVYNAVVSDLTNDGRQALPMTGLASGRVHAPFQSLLSFTNSELGSVLDQLAVTRSGGETTIVDASALRDAEFALAQLQFAHRQMLEMLRRAVRLRDSTTVRQALGAWNMPDVLQGRHTRQESLERVDAGQPRSGNGQTELLARLLQLGRSLDAARDDLDAMRLRLLVDALRIESATEKAEPDHARQLSADAQGNESSGKPSVRGIADQDPIVLAILDYLPVGRHWRALEMTLNSTAGDFQWPFDDEQILAAGVFVGGFGDTTAPVLEAFVLAAITRPQSVAGSQPSSQAALTDAQALHGAIDQVLAGRRAWLQRYGVSIEVAAQRCAVLKDQLAQTAQAALRERDEFIRTSPILPATVDELQTASRTAFHAGDITSRLFAWAGNPPSGTSCQQARQTLARYLVTVPRGIFVSEDTGDIPRLGSMLGGGLAQQLLAQFLVTAFRNSEPRTTSRADSAVQVRAAIAELSNPSLAGKEHASAVVKIVVIIPGLPYDLRNDIGVTGTEAEAYRHEKQRRSREEMAQELGLDDKLSWQLVGSIDGTPVIKTNVLDNRVVILDRVRLF